MPINVNVMVVNEHTPLISCISVLITWTPSGQRYIIETFWMLRCVATLQLNFSVSDLRCGCVGTRGSVSQGSFASVEQTNS